MKNKRVSIILSLLLTLSLFTTAFAETPEANLKRIIEESKNVLQTNSTAEQLVDSLMKLSSSLLRFENGTEVLEAPKELKVDDKTNILSWGADTRAESYEIVITNTKTSTEQKINLTENTKDISELLDFDVEYSIKVKAVADPNNSKYEDSEYSTEIKYIKTKATLAIPSELSVDPTTNILSWKAVPNAQSYEITLKNTKTNVEQKINATGNTQDISKLIDFDVEYSIKVKTIADPTGIYKDSEYSAEIKYTKLKAILETPTNLTVTTSMEILSWKAVSNAESYKISITNTKADTEEEIDLPTTTKSIKDYMLSNVKYSIRVKAIADPASEYKDSEYSAPIEYTRTAPIKTVLDKPTDLKVDSNNNILSWKAVPNAKSYTIIITNTKTNIELPAIAQAGITQDISALVDVNVEYSIKIKAIADSASIYEDSEYSAEIKYTRLPSTKPILDTPTGLKVVNNILSWTGVPNTNKYRVFIKNTQTGVEGYYTKDNVLSLDISKLVTIDVEYSIKVRAMASTTEYQDSEDSASINYTGVETVIPKLDKPTELKIDSSTNTLSWKAVPNARSYVIRLKNLKNNTEAFLYQFSNIANIYASLAFDEEYSIAVQAIADQAINKDSEYSSEIKYTKVKVALDAPKELSVDSNILSWKKDVNAKSYEIILKNTITNVEQKINQTENTKDISELLDFDVEYSIKVKAIADQAINKDSEYSSEIKYIKQETSVTLKAPVITSMEVENVVSKKTASHENDDIFALALTLRWSYAGNDEFVVKITEGTNTTNVKVAAGQRELRLNQYITKDSKYTIGIIAKNGSEESVLSNTKDYTAKNVCGHTNGFMFVADYNTSTGTKAYAVATPEQFEHVNLHKVETAFDGAVHTFIQMNDIDFNAKNYENSIIDMMFNVYDGQGFMVDNFKIEDTSVSGDPRTGVILQLPMNAKIKDFGVGPNALIIGHRGYVGAITGYAYAQIYRCYNFATVKSDGEAKATGGIAGYAGLTLEDCYNAGTIISEGNSATGGLVGIVDVVASVTFVNSYNTGTVTGKGVTGGIVGSLIDGKLPFTNCYNTGKITGITGKTGALVGSGKATSIIAKSAYYLDTTPSTIGVSKTDAYMRSAAFINDLKTNYQRFRQTANYPELTTNPHRNFK